MGFPLGYCTTGRYGARLWRAGILRVRADVRGGRQAVAGAHWYGVRVECTREMFCGLIVKAPIRYKARTLGARGLDKANGLNRSTIPAVYDGDTNFCKGVAL